MRQVVWSHCRLQSALYLKERQDFPWGSLFFAEDIPEPEWNHAVAVDLESGNLNPIAFEARLVELREPFLTRHLPLTFVLTRDPQLGDHQFGDHWPGELWPGLGFELSFRQVWHFADEEPDSALGVDRAIEIREVRRDGEMQAFLDVFASVYAVDLETGEPDTLPVGYSRSLRRSFEEPRDDIRVVHYLATVNGQPAGVSTSIHGLTGETRGVSGLYNLAVHANFRRQGLGGALVRRRVADARSLGQEIIFLQTERESVERRLPRHGFLRKFVTEGWTQNYLEEIR